MDDHNGNRTELNGIPEDLTRVNQRTACRTERNDSRLTEKATLSVEVQDNDMLLLFIYVDRTHLTDNILWRLNGTSKGTMRRANGATDKCKRRRKLNCRDFTDARNTRSANLLPTCLNKIGRRPEMLNQAIGDVYRT